MKNKNELDYILSLGALKKLLALGLLSDEEYALAEVHIAEKYRPLLRLSYQ